MSAHKRLLSVVELGGYPDFSPLYRRAGYEVASARSMRKALASLKSSTPDVVVAEFVYGPMYSTRISTLESLIAGIQRDAPKARLIVFFDREHAPHLERLSQQFPLFETLPFPIDEQRLAAALDRARETPVSSPRTG